MGIINVTPDSFSDGGQFLDPTQAIAHAFNLHQAGADIIDIGGASTRPGAIPVDVSEELNRILPVVRTLAMAGLTISIDTRRAAVMRAAIAAGAKIINDVSALTGDPDSLEVVAASKAVVVLMHMQGTPATMQLAPHYRDVALDIHDFLEERIDTCVKAGIAQDRLIIDPGIGFGKTPEHNFELLKQLALFHGLGCPLLIGVSRKQFISILSRGAMPNKRLGGSLAAALAGLNRGVHILRVHDVAETYQALAVWLALHT
jgi:dihydropteroate synthase